MSRYTTQTTGAAFDSSDDASESTHAGLVLLYAACHEAMAPAFPFWSSEVVVGRDAPADVKIPESPVSRRHASFLKQGDEWVVVDHDSRNGTWVDGVRVTRAVLSDRSRIRVGDAIFAFVSSAAEEFVPYHLDGLVRGVAQDDVRELVGGYAIRNVAAILARVAKTELSCLVYGESGTGKELVARAVHRLSGREGSLQAINCAAVPAQLFESELFGYKKGAFSGADRDKPGLVHGAHGGTLFLDEIAELPLELQAKLLRLLQSREVLPLGATRSETVDVRVVAATHQDLPARVAEGRFRGDLLARLDEHVFELPPLRARKEDVYMLATLFLRRHATRRLAVGFDVMDALLAYDWPFNVRELEACLKRAAALADGEMLRRKDLPSQVLRTGGAVSKPVAPQGSLPSRDTSAGAAPRVPEASVDPGFHPGAPTEAYLRRILAEHGGNIAAVARTLGKRRMQVQRYMQKYVISADEYRRPGVDSEGAD